MNIVIADPVFLVREGLKRVIEKNKDIILRGEIKNESEFWPTLKILKPDILIFCYNVPDFIEADELKKIEHISPDTKLLVISNQNRKETILKIIKYVGVLGYLTSECGEDEILNALEAVMRGEKFFCNKILEVILERHFYEDKTDCTPASLSEREIEIIKLISKGVSNKEISDQLFLSIHTVYTHRKNIMKKLKIKSPVELVLYALNSGIVD